ncbi:aminotransferase class I/II-fold pyridoxal phosphate-dependent enzyme [Occultella gossypii]|uniref:Aminotransferase class I/II-fold pyridoxal phosphate-dependent enzyme n=1 Tax=Occultella gossypii TaxID=2800820 RepID=A0ABS7SFK0_9MICO|nr:aminotransferase class I/II-fold pyridoxal phosphate-dependent enzyme [Occultella gossypii]MBZ2199127.1 aminotransferase class I/II-fold pyridoxal phosphate-dependent enzyme [Occultella gossypii]
MNARIHLSPPDVGADEEAAVLSALRSGWIAPLGPHVDEFESDLAALTERKHAVALSSGTAALHLGLLTLGVGERDSVITSTLTFAATANAIVYTGARPVFVDADRTGNMNPAILRHAIEDQEHRGRRVAAILPVDLFGKMADHESIGNIANEFTIPVLTDAAESLGALREGRRAGSTGNAAAVSFNGNKIITTSGGGALLTDDGAIAQRVRYLATQARQPTRHYEHVDIGYNYRLSNLLAALGSSQLRRLPAMIERRRAHRLMYREMFREVPGVSVFGGPDGSNGSETTQDNFWLTTIVVDTETAGWSANDLITHLEGADIEARPIWKPMHLQPVFASNDRYVDGTSESFFERGLSLPSGSSLGPPDTQRIRTAVERFLEGGRRT